MTNQSTPLINHFSALIEFKELSNDPEIIKSAANNIIEKLKLTSMDTLEHVFTPQGLTLIHLLSESHMAIHTWPENSTVHFDLICGSRLKEQEVEQAVKTSFSNLEITNFKFEEHKF